MKLWRLRLNFALTVLLAVPSLCADSWAVVIGIDSYERLRFPRHSFALKDAVGPPKPHQTRIGLNTTVLFSQAISSWGAITGGMIARSRSGAYT